MTKPSIYDYERRDQRQERSNLRTIIGFLALIVLTLGVVFLAWDFMHSPKIEAAPVVDDVYICTHLEEFGIDGQEAEIIRYCAKYL